jgi:hypothetical protein
MRKLVFAILAAALADSASAAEIVRRERNFPPVHYKVGDKIQWRYHSGPYNGTGAVGYLTGIPSGTAIYRDPGGGFWVLGTVDRVGTWAMEYHMPFTDRDGRAVEAVAEEPVIVEP